MMAHYICEEYKNSRQKTVYVGLKKNMLYWSLFVISCNMEKVSLNIKELVMEIEGLG